ncbi:MAG: DUF1566 domain-containing protein [Simplicispira sp.]|nr:DUF1566 domain-containing protein [Simplicispira sp.]
MKSSLFVWPSCIGVLTLGWAGAAAAQTPAQPALSPEAAVSAPPMAPATPTWTLEPSADGSLVLDRRTKLAWARCVEGMHWNGKTCTGQRQLFDRTQAIALVKARAKAEGVRWRLPRVNELRRLVDKKANPPGLPPKLFPAAPFGLHWTSTANIKHYANNLYNYTNIAQGSAGAASSRLAALDGWAVDMETGEASGDIPRNTKLPVRLVRPQD